MKTKTLTEKKCSKCNYTWFAKVEKPRQCPFCKSMKWEIKHR